MMRAEQVATTASYAAAAAGGGLGVWLSEHWLQLLSAFFMFATFVVQLYYTHRRDRRDQERHCKHMEQS